MKYVKTFESFQVNTQDELNEGAISWLKDVFGKVAEKFNAWKDKKAKEAAIKLAVVIEEKSNDPKVKAKLEEIKKAYGALSDEDKKTLSGLTKDEKSMAKLGEALDDAGIKEVIKESANFEGESLNESINESEKAKELIGKGLKILSISVAVMTIIYMCAVFCTLVGAGYVASWAIGAGMSAGAFAGCGCLVLAACGIIGHRGEVMASK
jgi:aromatic ring hydroxylase